HEIGERDSRPLPEYRTRARVPSPHQEEPDPGPPGGHQERPYLRGRMTGSDKASSTKRFSNRVHDYVSYRPSYPSEIVGLLQKEYGISRSSIVADIGCGTGKLAQVFLEAGFFVYGVEPNREMREASEAVLAAEK